MDWSLLGIAPTTDKKEITAAYRKQVVKVNPEDKPEDFKALRAAYEEALRMADVEQTESSPDKGPVDIWLDKVKALYADYPARIDAKNWEQLMKDDACLSLDSCLETEDALLRFLMEYYYLPQEVWQVFDATFSFMERKEELYEKYPRDFIDNAVISGIQFPASLPYDLFIPGKNAAHCDAFRQLYYRANRMKLEDAGDILEQMHALSEWHPYATALELKREYVFGDKDSAREGTRTLAEKYPEDFTLGILWARLCVDEENWTDAEKQVRLILDQAPNHWNAKHILAQCLSKQGNYSDAKELIYELMDMTGGDTMQMNQLGATIRQWNEQIIASREETMRNDPEDLENILELSWCYLQNERLEDAERAASMITEEYKDPYDYHNIHSRVLFAKQDYAGAIRHMEQLESIIRGLTPDGTKKMAKRIRKLADILQMMGTCLGEMGEEDFALEKFVQSLQIAPNRPEILTNVGKVYYGRKEYKKAVEHFQKLTEIKPDSYHGFLLLAMALYEMRRDSEAFNAINHALEMERGDLSVYTLKMRILIRNDVWEEVDDILEFLRRNGVGDALPVRWCDAQVAELRDKDNEKALSIYREIADRLESGEDMSLAAKVYFKLCTLDSGMNDLSSQENRDKLFALLEKGLRYDEDDADCLDFKAWLLKRCRKNADALQIYHKLEAMPDHSLRVELNLADLYYKDLTVYARKSLHYYQILIERNERAEYHFYAGNCCRYLQQFDQAIYHFKRELELDDEYSDACNGLAYVYEALARFEEALEQINAAIAMTEDREGEYIYLYEHKVQILRRLCRPQEAVDTVNACRAKYSNYDGGYEMCFSIYCQFGLWDHAKKCLKQWQDAYGMNSRIADSITRLQIYSRHSVAANLARKNYGQNLNKEDAEELDLLFAQLKGDIDYQIKHWTKKLEGSGSDVSRYYMNLARVQWHAFENKTDAVRNAQKAIQLIDKELEKDTLFKTLYYSRKALMLAILGREAEARDLLSQVRSMPLCRGCEYGSCKDADIFEAEMEAILGNYAEAAKLCKLGQQKWPDETDFRITEYHLKGKK